MPRKQEKPWILYVDAPEHKRYALATFEYNFKYLIVSVIAAPEPAPDTDALTRASVPLTTRLVQYLRASVEAEEQEINKTFDDDNYEDGWEKNTVLTEKVEKAILGLARPLFDRRAPPVKTLPNGLSLQDLVWYQQVHFRLETVDGKPKILEISPDQAACAPKPETQPLLDSTFTPDPRFPIYSAADIQIFTELEIGGGGPVCKVLVNGEIMLSKTPQQGLKNEELLREMAALVTIYDAEGRRGIEIATPHLLGYVKHAETGAIIGFVREWVESSRLGATLHHIPMTRMPLDMRQKWADQIGDAMDDLHDIGLFWGDCKPANIIVDRAQDIWLIDLGGSFTQDWVDKELTGTLAGDVMGLSNIHKFLGVIQDYPNR